MVNLVEFLLSYVFIGKNAVAYCEEQDGPSIWIVHSMEQARELLEKCKGSEQEAYVASCREHLEDSRLVQKSGTHPFRISGSAAVFLHEMSQFVRLATMQQMLAVDSAERLRAQFTNGTSEPVGVIHITLANRWYVHVVYAKLQARQVLVDYNLETLSGPHRLALEALNQSDLPEESQKPDVFLDADAALTIGISAESYWQLLHVHSLNSPELTEGSPAPVP